MCSPSLTVIVPNYNHAQLLPYAIKLLSEQSYSPDEIIVVDDGSSDHSVEVAKGLQVLYPQLKLITHDQNQGTVSALNTGLASSSGELVYFSSTNDYIFPGFFEDAIQSFRKEPRSHLFCADFFFRDTTTKQFYLHRYNFDNHEKFYSKDEIFAFYKKRKNFSLSTVASIYKTTTAIKFGGFQESIEMHADWFLIQCIALKYGLYYSPNPFAVFQVENNSYSSNILRNPERCKKVYKAILDSILKLRDKNLASKFRSPYTVQLPNNARKRILSHLILSPSYWRILSPRWVYSYIHKWSLRMRIWDIVWFFIKFLNASLFNRLKIFVLRRFGAKILGTPIIHANVIIERPWLLKLHDGVTLMKGTRLCGKGSIEIKEAAYIGCNSLINSSSMVNFNNIEIYINENIIIPERGCIKEKSKLTLEIEGNNKIINPFCKNYTLAEKFECLLNLKFD